MYSRRWTPNATRTTPHIVVHHCNLGFYFCNRFAKRANKRTPAPNSNSFLQEEFPRPSWERARPVECSSFIPRGKGEGVNGKMTWRQGDPEIGS